MCPVSLYLVPWHVPRMSQHHSGHGGGSGLSWAGDLGAELGVGKMSYLPGTNLRQVTRMRVPPKRKGLHQGKERLRKGGGGRRGSLRRWGQRQEAVPGYSGREDIVTRPRQVGTVLLTGKSHKS